MILTISHSSRQFGAERTSLNFLQRRYANPDRLSDLPPFETLKASPAGRYEGRVSLWHLSEDPSTPPANLGTADGDYRIQHAVVVDNELIICGLDKLEVVSLPGGESRELSDPWFQDGHTVFSLPDGGYAVSCSASDAVLLLAQDGRVRQRLRVPEELYGANYPLTEAHDLHQHVIPNDYQLTHLNCAWPCDRGILVSGLIPGMVGLFDHDGQYRELTRGFVGIHGVRTRDGLDGFYFADSALGCLVEMDWAGQVIRRFRVDSLWLHDVQHVNDSIYLFSLSDHNRVECWDTKANEQLWTLPCSSFGNTTQFFSITREPTIYDRMRSTGHA